jgi:hypothetical protein
MERMRSFALEIEENNISEMIFKKIKNYHTKFIFQNTQPRLSLSKEQPSMHATPHHIII